MHYLENNFSPIVEYDLSKIPESVKIAIQVGTGDKLSTPADSRILRDKIKSKGLVSYKEYEHMGHLTFLIPNEKVIGFIGDTIDILNQYYKSTVGNNIE